MKADVDCLAFVRIEFLETVVWSSLYLRTEHCKMGGFIGRYAARCRPLYGYTSAMQVFIYRPTSLPLNCVNESC